MKWMIAYLLLINVISYGAMGRDKALAARGKRRIPEKRLFGLAWAGGGLGAWIGMQSYRHKTKHPSFTVGIPALIAVNAACVYALWRWVIA